jgi:dipeptidyl aminopeptidase/acylaminoacyl peptidase
VFNKDRWPHISCLAALLVVAGCADIPCRPTSYYAPPAKANYRAEAVRLPTPAGHVLAGTLTLPSDRPPPFPAVVLITGSSPQNRDMTGHWAWPVSTYRPFRQIADALSRKGVAVLRTDDRGCGCSEGGPLLEATTLDRADDNRAAVAFLRTRKDIDASQIGLLGMSEGGIIGPIIAASDPSIRALVVMAGCATNGWKIMEHQFRYEIERNPKLTEPQKQAVLAERMAQLKQAIRGGEGNPWLIFFLSYMPLPTAKRVRCPVLILHGDKDAHVPVTHADMLAQAMRAGGNGDVTVRIYEDIDHPFLPDTDGRKSGYKKLLRDGAVVPDRVLDAITVWLADRLTADR